MKVSMPQSFVERQSRLLREGELSAKRILNKSGGQNIIEECDGFRRIKTIDGKGTTRQILTLDEDYSHLSIMDKAGIVLKRTMMKLTNNGFEEVFHYFSPSKGSTTITKLDGKPILIETIAK